MAKRKKKKGDNNNNNNQGGPDKANANQPKKAKPEKTCPVCNTKYSSKKCPTEHQCSTCNGKYRGIHHTCPPLVHCSHCNKDYRGKICPDEHECAVCGSKFRGDKCKTCIKNTAKKKYFALPGIAYEHPVMCFGDDGFNADLLEEYLPAECNRIAFSSEQLTNEVLIGTYDLVFFSNYSVYEQVNRAVKGKVDITMKDVNGEPALHIYYRIDGAERVFRGEYDKGMKIQFFPRIDGECIEVTNQLRSSTKLLQESNGHFGSIFQKEGVRDEEFESALGRRNFIDQLFPDEAKPDDEWWNDLPEALTVDDEYLPDHFDEQDIDYWGMALKRISRRVPLGVSRDYPGHESNFNVIELNTNHILKDPKCLEVADNLSIQYKDGSNSWMCAHLGVPSSVAFQIREFVTPPPVFYLEEGDFVLYGEWWPPDIEMSCQAIIFRKPC